MRVSYQPKTSAALAIQPTTFGFGYVVCEGPNDLIEWMTATVSPDRKNAESYNRITALIEWYDPQIIIFEDVWHVQSRRSKRVKRLLYMVTEKMRDRGVEFAAYSRSDIRQVFKKVHAKTKHEIARSVAAHFPELRRHLPEKRKPWTAEHAKMSIFDAASLALTFYFSDKPPATKDIEF